MLTRRAMLTSTPALALAVTTPAAAMAAMPQLSARQRYDFHLAEMMKAATEINPLVRFTDSCDSLDDPTRPLAVMIMGQWAKGHYAGDGIYKGGGYFADCLYNVTLLDKPDKAGRRQFRLINTDGRNKPFTTSEPGFEAFIGRKVVVS